MNRVFDAVRIALSAIGRAKARAALTVLGILIGVAAVVIVTALGTGVRERIVSQLESFGSASIWIWPRSTQGTRAASGAASRLSEGDVRAIAREANSVSSVVPYLRANAQIVAGDQNVSTVVEASTPDYFENRGFKIDDGRAFSDAEQTTKARVLVLGSTVSQKLFGSQNGTGHVVRLGRHAYRIVGVMAPAPQSPGGDDRNDCVIMPITTFRARVMPMPAGRVGMIMAQASDLRTVERASAQIDAILRQRHHLGDDDEPDFGIATTAEFLKTTEDVLDTLRKLLIGIALVSLGVGGIGVMNIMLVSVAERTREIGIRMAIGASEANVLGQFLVEAVVLCLIGGISGAVIGVGGIVGLSLALGWSMRLPAEALPLALATSVFVGLVFGILPARRAARLDPIEALRRE